MQCDNRPSRWSHLWHRCDYGKVSLCGQYVNNCKMIMVQICTEVVVAHVKSTCDLCKRKELSRSQVSISRLPGSERSILHGLFHYLKIDVMKSKLFFVLVACKVICI